MARPEIILIAFRLAISFSALAMRRAVSCAEKPRSSNTLRPWRGAWLMALARGLFFFAVICRGWKKSRPAALKGRGGQANSRRSLWVFRMAECAQADAVNGILWRRGRLNDIMRGGRSVKLTARPKKARLRSRRFVEARSRRLVALSFRGLGGLRLRARTAGLDGVQGGVLETSLAKGWPWLGEAAEWGGKIARRSVGELTIRLGRAMMRA